MRCWLTGTTKQCAPYWALNIRQQAWYQPSPCGFDGKIQIKGKYGERLRQTFVMDHLQSPILLPKVSPMLDLAQRPYQMPSGSTFRRNLVAISLSDFRPLNYVSQDGKVSLMTMIIYFSHLTVRPIDLHNKAKVLMLSKEPHARLCKVVYLSDFVNLLLTVESSLLTDERFTFQLIEYHASSLSQQISDWVDATPVQQI